MQAIRSAALGRPLALLLLLSAILPLVAGAARADGITDPRHCWADTVAQALARKDTRTATTLVLEAVPTTSKEQFRSLIETVSGFVEKAGLRRQANRRSMTG